MPSPQSRLDSDHFSGLVPEAYPAIEALGKAAESAGLEPALLELVNLRASQINGCAYCVQYHTANARRLGVAEARLTLVVVWAETGVFSAREEAAFAWTEALTLVASSRVPDAAFAAATQVFSDVELAALTTAIAAINVWNRISVSYRFAPAAAS